MSESFVPKFGLQDHAKQLAKEEKKRQRKIKVKDPNAPKRAGDSPLFARFLSFFRGLVPLARLRERPCGGASLRSATVPSVAGGVDVKGSRS